MPTSVTVPDHTATFALCTFGRFLLERHRLAMMLHQKLFPQAPPWTCQSFRLTAARPEVPPVIDIRHASLDDPRAVPLLERVIAIKGLAVLLRFAYLADLPIRAVGIRLAGAAASELRTGQLFAAVADGPMLELRLIDEPSGQLLLLQGGAFETWFDPERWTVMAPIHRSPPRNVSLSESRRFSSRHASILSAIGAIEVRPDCWSPPPASAIDDLEEFVAQNAHGGERGLPVGLLF